jgi:hypothetical protein
MPCIDIITVSDIILLIVFCSATHIIGLLTLRTKCDRMMSSERSVEFLWLCDCKSIFFVMSTEGMICSEVCARVRVMNRRLWVVFHVARATPYCLILMVAAFDNFGHDILASFG